MSAARCVTTQHLQQHQYHSVNIIILSETV